MKVKTTKAFYATKTGAVARNTVLDLPEKFALDLIGGGLAEPVPEEKAKKATKKTGKQAKA